MAIDKIKEAVRLFISNLALFSKIILTVWLPGSILLVFLSYYVFPSMADGDEVRAYIMELRVSNIIELAFSPIYGGALLYALSRIKQGLNVSYSESMNYASKRSFKLFSTRFSTGLIVFLGFIALIIPGIILSLRLALVDEVVVLEGVSSSQARKLSAKLTEGKRIEIFLTTLIVFILMFLVTMIFSFLLYLPLGIIGQENNFLCDVIAQCFTSIIFSFFYIVLFLFYWESKNNLIDAN